RDDTTRRVAITSASPPTPGRTHPADRMSAFSALRRISRLACLLTAAGDAESHRPTGSNAREARGAVRTRGAGEGATLRLHVAASGAADEIARARQCEGTRCGRRRSTRGRGLLSSLRRRRGRLPIARLAIRLLPIPRLAIGLLTVGPRLAVALLPIAG